jgi:hypothetical protein
MNFNRDIDEQRINQAKSRTIEYVLDNVAQKTSIFSIFSSIKFKLVLSAMVLVFAVIIGISLFNPTTPSTRPVLAINELSQEEQQVIVETSYISGNIIVNALRPSLEAMSFKEAKTRFNDNSSQFDDYFQMLKPFIDEVDFSQFQVEQLNDETYDYRINYNIDGQNYLFDLSGDEEGNINGQMLVKNITFQVSGFIKDEENELEVEIMANANEDYISIEYKHEKESDESNKEYYIEEYINGQYKERTIEIKRENDEVSLELTENSNYYELTKEISDIITYKLEYEIDGVEGEGTITEIIVNDEVFYRYHIEEDGEEEEFEFEDDDEDEDNEDDDEDEEDLEDEEDEEDSEDEEDLEDEEEQEETETEGEEVQEEIETEDDEEDIEDEEESDAEESEDE